MTHDQLVAVIRFIRLLDTWIVLRVAITGWAVTKWRAHALPQRTPAGIVLSSIIPRRHFAPSLKWWWRATRRDMDLLIVDFMQRGEYGIHAPRALIDLALIEVFPKWRARILGLEQLSDSELEVLKRISGDVQ